MLENTVQDWTGCENIEQHTLIFSLLCLGLFLLLGGTYTQQGLGSGLCTLSQWGKNWIIFIWALCCTQFRSHCDTREIIHECVPHLKLLPCKQGGSVNKLQTPKNNHLLSPVCASRWPACRWAGRSSPSTRTCCSSGPSPRWKPWSARASVYDAPCGCWSPPKPRSEEI